MSEKKWLKKITDIKHYYQMRIEGDSVDIKPEDWNDVYNDYYVYLSDAEFAKKYDEKYDLVDALKIDNPKAKLFELIEDGEIDELELPPKIQRDVVKTIFGEWVSDELEKAIKIKFGSLNISYQETYQVDFTDDTRYFIDYYRETYDEEDEGGLSKEFMDKYQDGNFNNDDLNDLIDKINQRD